MSTIVRYRTDNFSIREAVPADAPVIARLIRELAEYERLSDECFVTPELLDKWVFQEKKAEVIMGEAAGDVVAFALFFPSFSTFLAKPGLYLEDLFVVPKARGNGYGRRMLQYLSRQVLRRGYGRLEWACLDWNKPSIGFYLSLGAVPLDEWTTYRLSGEALAALAGAKLPQ